MILKLLLIATVISIVYILFFKNKSIKTNQKHKNQQSDTNVSANDMIECVNCGIYSELSTSILSDGKYYCSSECATKAL